MPALLPFTYNRVMSMKLHSSWRKLARAAERRPIVAFKRGGGLNPLPGVGVKSPRRNKRRQRPMASEVRSRGNALPGESRSRMTGFPGLTGARVDFEPQLIVAVGAAGSGRLAWTNAVVGTWPSRREDSRGALVVARPTDFFAAEGISYSGAKMRSAGQWALRAVIEGARIGGDVLADGGTGAFSALSPIVEIGLAYELSVRVVIFVSDVRTCSSSVRTSDKVLERQVRRVERLVETWPGFWPTPEVLDVTLDGEDRRRLQQWGVDL